MENCPFDVTPFDQSLNVRRPGIKNLAYTNQDFDSMKTRLVKYAQEHFGTEFNDFVEGQLAIMLIEQWAFLADTLSFKMDQIANEMFLDTVTEIENAFRLAKLVGFQPQPPIAATALFSATINNPLLTDVRIPAPLDISVQSGDQPIDYELFPADADNNPIYDEDILIPAGSVSNTAVVGVEGRTRTQQVSGTGNPGQSILLNFRPVIWDSVRVTVDGVRWEQVEAFTDSQRRREYRVEFDSQYNAYVMFGNNRTGLLPSQGSTIIVTYRTGGGTVGNIIQGFVQTETIVSVPGLDYSVPVSFRNYTRGRYGYNGDGIEDIRRKLPNWIKTQNRAVTGLDYKTIADQFATPYNGQVGKSTAVLRNYGCAGNVIDLFILARNGESGLTKASSQLKAALQEEIDSVKMLTDHVCIRDGSVVLTDVSIDVVLDKFYRRMEDEIREKIRRRLNDFFSITNWDYNDDLKESDILKVLSDVPEPLRYEITLTTDTDSGSSVTAKYYEIIRLDTLELSFIYE